MKKILPLTIVTITSFCMAGCTFNREESVCNHSYKDSIVREATCAEKGIIESICEKCENKIVAYIDCIPHEYEGGVCKGCGEREAGISDGSSSDTGSNDISGDGNDSSGTGEQTCQHNYEWDIVREASCKEEGIKEYACTKCGEVRGEPQLIEKTEKHHYVNSKCTVCGKEDNCWTDFH